MSLLGGLHIGASALEAHRRALAVIGNNIANAATPGYVRQEVDLAAIPETPESVLDNGHGVRVAAIVQKVDRFLQLRLQESGSQLAGATANANYLKRAEKLLGELGDGDLSSRLTAFFNSIQDVQNHPEDPNLRALVVQQGDLLADSLHAANEAIDAVRGDISASVRDGANTINGSLRQIARFNAQIVEAQTVSPTDAGNLRQLRDQQVEKLGQYLPLRIVETPTGAINVFADQEPLVFEGYVNEVKSVAVTNGTSAIEQLVFVESNNSVPTSGGKLGGGQQASETLGEVAAQLDQLAAGLIYEFNKLHSSGQGLEALTQTTGANRVLDPSAALDSSAAGLTFPPTNGSFELRIQTAAGGPTITKLIDVNLDGTAGGDSLNSLVTKLNTAFGSTVASVDGSGRLALTAPTGVKFTFANDTSGVLASLGVNSFFTGSTAKDIGVSTAVASNPRLFAAAGNGAPGDTSIASQMVALQDKALGRLGGNSLNQSFLGVLETLGSEVQAAQSTADAIGASNDALKQEHESISGVSIDEETIKLITFQRAYQASARYISTIQDLLDEVMNMVR